MLHVAIDGDRKLVHSGPAFTVQVKSRRTDLVYKKDHERKWIGEQFDPFFVCVVSRAKASCEIYSTWNVLNAVLMHGTGNTPARAIPRRRPRRSSSGWARWNSTAKRVWQCPSPTWPTRTADGRCQSTAP